jgi:hypothetical protein
LDTTMWPVSVTLPPFLVVKFNVCSSTFSYARVSEAGSPLMG